MTTEAQKESLSLGRMPAARRKAAATMRRNQLAKVSNNQAPTKKARGKRRLFSEAQKANLIAQVKAHQARGVTIYDACTKIGINQSQYYAWIKEKPGGTTTTIDVASLVLPRKGKGSGKPRPSPQQRIRLLAKVRAAAASGVPIKVAAKKAGISDSVYYRWLERPQHYLKKGGARNGNALNGDAVGVTVRIGGQPVAISLAEAVSIHEGLTALLQTQGRAR